MFTPTGWWMMLALLRVLVGVGVGGLNIVSIPYVQEFVPTRQRGLLAGLGSVFIPFGLFLGSLAQRVLHDNWRGLIALGVLPILLLAWIRIVPESPRFLLSHGREREARESIAWALELSPDDVGALPPVRTGPRIAYGELLRKHLRALLIVSVGSFCFILGSFTVQSWGQTLLEVGFTDIGADAVGTLFMGVSLVICSGAWPRPGSPTGSGGAGRCSPSGSSGPWARSSWPSLPTGRPPGSSSSPASASRWASATVPSGSSTPSAASSSPPRPARPAWGWAYGIGAVAKVVGPYVVGALIRQ